MTFIRVVESPSTLRFSPTTSERDKLARLAFGKLHKLRHEYFKDMLNGGSSSPVGRETGNVWQLCKGSRLFTICCVIAWCKCV